MNLRALELVGAIMAELEKTTGPVVLHGGHFRLAADNAGVYPLVVEELEKQNAAGRLIELARLTAGVFPLATFELCLELASRLRVQAREARIITLVDDCLHPTVRQSTDGRKGAREAFLRKYPVMLSAYESAWAGNGLGRECLGLPGYGQQLFESRLRKKFETRFKSWKKHHSTTGIVMRASDGVEMINGLSCPVMSRGQTNCAGEVAELRLLLMERGYKTFVNFYPAMCQGFVEASMEIVDALGRRDGYVSIEIGLRPGAETIDELLGNMIRNWR